jgi:hypothetical protein
MVYDSACCEFKWVINQVASNSDADMVGVLLLRTMIYYNSSVGSCSVFGDVANVALVQYILSPRDGCLCSLP